MDYSFSIDLATIISVNKKRPLFNFGFSGVWGFPGRRWFLLLLISLRFERAWAWCVCVSVRRVQNLVAIIWLRTLHARSKRSEINSIWMQWVRELEQYLSQRTWQFPLRTCCTCNSVPSLAARCTGQSWKDPLWQLYLILHWEALLYNSRGIEKLIHLLF